MAKCSAEIGRLIALGTCKEAHELTKTYETTDIRLVSALREATSRSRYHVNVVVGKSKSGDEYPWAKVLPLVHHTTNTSTRGKVEVIPVKLAFVPSKTAKLKENGEAHASSLLVDHANKTVEYFDPHGALAAWNDVVWPALIRAIQDQDKRLTYYQPVPPWSTCPLEGMQIIYNKPYCEWFSGVYEYLRLACPDVSAFTLQTHLVAMGRKQLKKLIQGWVCYLVQISN